MDGPDLDLPTEPTGASQDLLRFAVTSLLAPTLLLDGGGVVEAASPAALADLDRAPDVLVGTPAERAIGVSLDQLRRSDPAVPQVAELGELRLRWRAVSLARARVDGGWLVEIELAADGGAHLEDRSDRLEVILEDLADRFEALNRYVGLISHDLQAPSRRLLSLIELLRGDIERDLPIEDRLEAIERSARHQLRLTSELLEYARLGSRPLLLGPVDADAVLRDTLEQLSVALDGHDARVALPDRPLPTVVAAPTFLGVVFQHLVENALRYRRDDADPEIVVSWREVGDDVAIDVADNGQGIQPELRDAVFAPFRRLQPRDDAHTGLGLATVRDLVGRFGGTIDVTASEVGVGSTFTVVLGRSGSDREA